MINPQRGMGVPEVLVSLLLASLITTALLNHYLGTKQQYQQVEKNLEKAYEMQLLTELIRGSVRHAGFTPCRGINHLITLDTRNHHKNIKAIEVMGDAQSSFKINRMSEYFDSVVNILRPTELLITRRQVLNPEHPILVADCYHAEIHQISKIRKTATGQKITLTKALSFEYQPPIYLGELLEETYFLRSLPNQKSSLFYQMNHADELSADIHTMFVHLDHHQNRLLLDVILGLDNGKSWQVATKVRTP